MAPGWRAIVLDATQPGLERVGEMVRDQAKRLAPVDTGRLRAGIYNQQVRRAQHIGAPHFPGHPPYAHYQEFGTRRNRPQPYLRPAAYTWYGEIR